VAESHTDPAHRDGALLNLLLVLQQGLRLAPLILLGLREAGIGPPLLRCLGLKVRVRFCGNWGKVDYHCELWIEDYGLGGVETGLCDCSEMMVGWTDLMKLLVRSPKKSSRLAYYGDVGRIQSKPGAPIGVGD